MRKMIQACQLVVYIMLVGLVAEGADQDGLIEKFRVFNRDFLSGKLSADSVEVKEGGIRRFVLRFLQKMDFQHRETKLVFCKDSIVEFYGSQISEINTKSPGCKVGDYEAAAGTTITFSAGQSNFLTSIVTAKPVKARGREWPANSKLLFYFKDGGDIFVYAVVLGEDLKGTPYKKGDKVYIGSIMEEDDKMSDELSLSGEDPTC
ncbi:MAG: hypothetical protein H6624_08420 [Bdellovibrionaceae bacterium]|nr:hypothetical protein [Pseudobdellovibrionaceae bacterium]